VPAQWSSQTLLLGIMGSSPARLEEFSALHIDKLRPVCPPSRNEHSLLFRRMEGRTENFTRRGQNSPAGDKIHPWGTKFATRDEVKNGPLLLKLKHI
jgi:hypothetical protein